MDSVPKSWVTRQFAEDSTTAADGVGGEERLATTAGDSMEIPGATARATESLEAGAGATDIVLDSRAQGPVALEEQAVRPEMPQGMVGFSVRLSSP